MRRYAYLQSAQSILMQYDGVVPFAAWLKNFFKQHKKFGSRDRKLVADLCFCYFRLGSASKSMSIEEALLHGQFLCHGNSSFITELKPEWVTEHDLTAEKKLIWLGLDESSLFPFLSAVSSEIDRKGFAISHLTQPDLFLRIRRNKRNAVIKKLESAKISYSMEDDTVRLANNTKIDDVLLLDEEVVVQDKNSQKVLDALQSFSTDTEHHSFTAWDCCAASGGKSILLHDLFPAVQLSVSDIRESILHNLRNRFKRAGIQQYESFVTDVSSVQFHSKKKYDVILCDAPCSGSGTWGRTPEQLTYFKQEKIDHYAKLQKQIAVNASKSLKEGGLFVYITCSVYKKENEEVVDFLQQHTTLTLVSQEYKKGYSEKADTLFTALFRL